MPAWILEPCLETAEKNNVSLNIEIHGGLGFGCPKTDEYIAEMLRLNSPYIGIVPDTPIPEIEQVTAHQKLVQKLIKEIEG